MVKCGKRNFHITCKAHNMNQDSVAFFILPDILLHIRNS